MTTKKSVLALLTLATLSAAGCGGDIAKQIGSNEQMRGQVMDAIAQNTPLAMQAVDRMMSPDSLRVAVVDHMLGNKDVAQQVIVRIATNPDAIDMVLGVALRDSTMRGHVLTLMKGMQMAGAK